MGGIIQSTQGACIKEYSRKCGSISSNEAEVLRLLLGVKLANSMGIQNSLVEGDSLLVIKVIKGYIMMRWNATLIFIDTQCIFNGLNDF